MNYAIQNLRRQMIFFTRRVWPPQTHRCAMVLPPLLSVLREGLLHDHYDHCDHHNHQEPGMDREGFYIYEGLMEYLCPYVCPQEKSGSLIQRHMSHESSEDSSNQPDGPRGSPRCPLWPPRTPWLPQLTPSDISTGLLASLNS